MQTISPRRAKKRRLTQHRLAVGPIYAGVRTGVAVANIAGIDPSMRTMRRMGGAWASVPFNRRRLARATDNISWCFPNWDQDRVQECASEAYRHLFTLAAELALTPRLLNPDGYASHIELGYLDHALREICSDRPCITITGHCGNWELLGYTLALLGFPMYALYRPLDMRPLDEWVKRTRQRQGLTLVDKFGATQVMPTILEEKGPIGFIADQNAGDGGLMVPFFNRLASSYKAIGLLAARHEAPIICGQARRLSGFRNDSEIDDDQGMISKIVCQSHLFTYRLEILDIIRPEDWKSQPDPIFYITARYRRAIEQMVRRAPEQYLWMHRYWKSRPAHERAGRPFPPALREKIASLPWTTDEDLERIVERSDRDAREMANHRSSR